MKTTPEPTAPQAEPSDEQIEDFLAARMTPEGRVPMIKTIKDALKEFSLRPAPVAEPAASDAAEPECVTCQRCGFENWIQDGEAPGTTTARVRKLAAAEPPQPVAQRDYLPPPVSCRRFWTGASGGYKESVPHYSLDQVHAMIDADRAARSQPIAHGNDEREAFEAAWQSGEIERPEHQRRSYLADDIETAERMVAISAWQARAACSKREDVVPKSLLRAPSKPGERMVCYCPPGVCQAPKGFSGPCNRAAASTASGGEQS